MGAVVAGSDQVAILGEQALTRILARNPQGRLLAADEVAAAVAFLLGEEAAGINGAALEVDGGELAG